MNSKAVKGWEWGADAESPRKEVESWRRSRASFRFCALTWISMLLCTGSVAQTPVWTTPPRAEYPIQATASEAVVAEYVAHPDIIGMARNLVREPPEPLALELPDGTTTHARIVRSDLVSGFGFDAQGNIVVDPHAGERDLSYRMYAVDRGKELSLVVHEGRLTGSLTGAFRKLHQAWTVVERGGRLVLRELDMSRTGRHPEGEDEGGKSGPQVELVSKQAVDGGGSIDVLVVHSPNAVAVAGSEAAVHDLVRGSVFDMQVALQNSLAYRVQINHVQPSGAASVLVNYDEAPLQPDPATRFLAHRRWMRASAEVTALRNTHLADLVVMVVGDGQVGPICGIGYTQRPNCGGTSQLGCGIGAAYDGFAYSVISSRSECGLPTRTFAHEVGHQLGMEHDPVSPSSPALNASFPWSFGHVVSTVSVQARSIMAYEQTDPSDAEFNCPFGCPIQLHYSNAYVDFQAFPGTPSGTMVPNADGKSSMNARTAVILAPGTSALRGPLLTPSIFGHGFELLPDIVCNPAVWPNCPQP